MSHWVKFDFTAHLLGSPDYFICASFTYDAKLSCANAKPPFITKRPFPGDVKGGITKEAHSAAGGFEMAKKCSRDFKTAIKRPSSRASK